MAQDCVAPSNQKLDAAIIEIVADGHAGSYDDLKAKLHAVCDAQAGDRPAQTAVPLPARATSPAAENFLRVIYPHGNMRVELVGIDAADVDEQERRIRALYES